MIEQQEPFASALLVTKLYLPPARPNLVARPELIARLEACIAHPLTVVAAPAGFGKTTLLSEWRASPAGARHALAWLSLDVDDNDPLRFLQYLVAAVDSAAPGAGGQAAALLRLPGAPSAKGVVSALVNGLVAASGAKADGATVVLVLDDYHLLQNTLVHEAVVYLLEHLPASLRLVILSRIDPLLPLSRFRVRGQLAELRANDLRFTAEEAAAFLNDAMGLELSAEDVEALETRTEGWIAALQLAAICLKRPQATSGLPVPGVGSGRPAQSRAARFIEEFGASNRYVAEYLMDEVLGRQAQHVQDFLLRTSILERMCAPLCEAVLSGAGAAGQAAAGVAGLGHELLAEVERANLFLVPLDDEGYWYRYHHLFRDFLRGRLAHQRGGTQRALTALHGHASEWYEANGYLNESVRHAVQGNDMGRAADLVERYANPMLCRSEVKALQGWYALLPEELIRARPMLAVYHAWALNLLPGAGSHELIERRLQEAETLSEQISATTGDDGIRRLVAGHAATIRVYFLEHAAQVPHDYEGVIALAETAEELLPDSEVTVHGANQYNMGRAYIALGDLARADAAFEESRRLGLRVGNDYVAVSSFYYRGRIAYLRGRLHEAAQMLREGIAGREWFPRRDLIRLPALGAAHVALGCILLEWNKLDEAEECLSRGLDALQYAFVHGAVEAGYAALARLRQIRGDTAGVDAAIERLTRIAPAGPLYAAAVRAACQLDTAPVRPPATAVAWAKERPEVASEAGYPFGGSPWDDARYLAFLTAARIQVATGFAAQLLDPLRTRVAGAEAAGLALRANELRMVQALAYNALGENRRAFEALQPVLEFAEREKAVRILVCGPGSHALLAEAAARGMAVGYIDSVLAGLGLRAPRAETESAGTGRDASRTATAGDIELLEPLTEREHEILELTAAGLSNAEIAAKLYVEVSTVKRHMNHILGKLGAGNRIQAVARARALGMLN